mgnify:CR=1 FL=1
MSERHAIFQIGKYIFTIGKDDIIDTKKGYFPIYNGMIKFRNRGDNDAE